jgi:hypothetical protein
MDRLAARAEPAPDLVSLVTGLAGQGLSPREIARRLNRLNLRTLRGKQWYGRTIAKVLAAALRPEGGWHAAGRSKAVGL